MCLKKYIIFTRKDKDFFFVQKEYFFRVEK